VIIERMFGHQLALLLIWHVSAHNFSSKKAEGVDKLVRAMWSFSRRRGDNMWISTGSQARPTYKIYV
jgi:hypothetical protein